MATTHPITDEDLLGLPQDGNKRELVDGEIRVSPAGLRHERVVARLLGRLQHFVEDRQLGDVLGSNLLYVLPSGNRRGPDVSFLAAARIALVADSVFPELAPDLAVEVLSPGDAPRQVLDKVGEYLQAGVPLVWVIDAAQRTAVVYRSLTDVRRLDETEALEGEDVVPGFSCPLRDILA